ncbi:hypothetical protein [Ectothiorhodospira shaposhnikovii]|uniref:hypothetical protein n=1 Tax=Ectothiorhodospira shaposhnikovii TaxID=1054 RepID=UPI001EE7F0B3|nr:hypothetical protein [Ectothiorhodospira shaposhnikovii]MCG5512801.1 hypothetical protein [Ectothiorhodospira shaposhnikovii]
MRLFSLRHFENASLRRKLTTDFPALAGSPIGRGHFSAVWDNGDTVLKLTCDPGQWDLWEKVTGEFMEPKHIPNIIREPLRVGMLQTRVPGLKAPAYLIEMEKLQKPTGTAAKHKRVILKAINEFGFQSATTALSKASEKLEGLLPDSIIQTMQLIDEILVDQSVRHDLHGENFMQRGEDLVFCDPFVSLKADHLKPYSLANLAWQRNVGFMR